MTNDTIKRHIKTATDIVDLLPEHAANHLLIATAELLKLVTAQELELRRLRP